LQKGHILKADGRAQEAFLQSEINRKRLRRKFRGTQARDRGKKSAHVRLEDYLGDKNS